MKSIVFMHTLILIITVYCNSVIADASTGDTGRSSSEKRGRIIAFYTSTSETRLITTTITALSTCFSFSANAPVCNGRRKRGIIRDSRHLKDLEMFDDDVDSSMQSSPIYPTKSSGIRYAKKLTIWTTSLTTLTITSTSYLQGTTVSVSVLCILGGAANSCVG